MTSPHQRFQSFYSQLNESQLEEFSTLLRLENFEMDQHLLAAGCTDPRLLVVRRGWAEICREQVTAAEPWKTLNIVGPGELLGEVNGADGLGNSASVVALCPMSCWVLDWETFCGLCMRHRAWFDLFANCHAGFVRDKNLTDALRGAHNVDMAVAATLLFLHDKAVAADEPCGNGFPYPFNRTLIARFTGHSYGRVRESLNKLKSRKAIACPETHTCELLDMEILRAAAQGRVPKKSTKPPG